MENSIEGAQRQLNALNEESKKVGLEVNTMKTVQMRLNIPEDFNAPHLTIDGEKVEVVQDFKYLGSHMNSDVKDIEARIALAWGAFHKLEKILTSRHVGVMLRVRFFNAACVSILLYGCESWLVTKSLSIKLDVFARKCYRRMIGVVQSEDRMTNKDLYDRVQSAPISTLIRHRQMSFTGHCLRMNQDEPANIYMLYTSNVRASNRRGRPRMSYLDQMSTYMGYDRKSITAEDVRREATEAKGEKWKLRYCRLRSGGTNRSGRNVVGR